MALGGGTLAAGAFLPWLTLYGGLHVLAGTFGPVGKGLAFLGLAMMGLALHAMRRPAPRGIALAAGLGAVALAVVVHRWLAAQAFVADPDHLMLVPALGDGLRIAAAGAIVTMLGAVLSWRATTFEG